MQEFKLTVELSEADRARLDKIALLLGALNPHLRAMATAPAALEPDQAQGATAAAAPVAEEPFHPVTTSTPWDDDPAPAAPTYTLDDITALVRKLVSPGSGKRAEAKALVQKYAAKVKDIPEDKYAEVYKALQKLEADNG